MNESQVMHALGLDDAYHVERVLAQGAAGVTELVTIDGCGPFVRKKMPLALANRGVWARLGDADSDRLPRVAATYEMPDQFVAVYDYVPGSILEQTVRTGGAYPVGDALRCILEVCEAISALHAVGVIHLDITPGNIVMAADGAHVIDLGLSRVVSEPAPRASHPLGTWGFAAPEQCGFGSTDARTDVYAIGKLLAYLLVGESEEFSLPTFDAEGHAEIPEALRAVIARACQMEPSRRYQGVDEFVEALRVAGGFGDTPLAEVDARAAGSSSSKGIPWEVAGVGEPLAKEGPHESSAGAPSGTRGDFDCGYEASRCMRNDDAGHSDAAADGRAAGVRRPPLRVVLVIAAVLVVLFVAVSAVVMGRDAMSGEDEPASAAMSDTGADGKQEGAASGQADTGDVLSTDEGLEGVQPVRIIESGYTVDDDGYVFYSVALKNSNDGVLLKTPAFRVTGYDANGSVLFSEEHYVGALGAGETHWDAGQAGGGAVPARVAFAPIEPDSSAVKRSGAATPEYTVEGLSAQADGYGGTTFSGTVSMLDEGTYADSPGNAAVAIVLRDKAGKAVWGNTVFVSAVGKGSAVPFSGMFVNVPAYATMEAHVQAWM